MPSRVLISGGSGLLGLNWALQIKNTHDVVLGIHQRIVQLPSLVTHQLSLESADDFLRSIDLIQPDYVIHAAAIANIELCEENPDLAFHVNVELAENVARACALRGIKLAHISTDHLFRGDQKLLDEGAPVDPVNIYGKTKAEAERRVQDVNPEALVIRTNFYGWGPSYRQSFSDWVLSNLKLGNSITLFKDVFYTPIYIGRLVNIVHQLFERLSSGIYHIVGDERVSKYEFAMRLATAFHLNADLISAGVVSSHPYQVVRPLDMSLSTAKVRKELNMHTVSIEDDLLQMKQSNFLE